MSYDCVPYGHSSLGQNWVGEDSHAEIACSSKMTDILKHLKDGHEVIGVTVERTWGEPQPLTICGVDFSSAYSSIVDLRIEYKKL